jgi:DNA-binding IclR family transcriptional regulator
MAAADDFNTSKPKDRQFISALAKGLQVLRCFTTHGPELGASDIAAITGIPQPTAWRICHTLLELGYLVAEPDRNRMRLGLAVLSLGYSVLSATPIERLAISEMEAIARRYEGAVSLGAPDELEMVYIQRCQGSAIIHANLRIGSRVPMATSGTGWAYLAALTEPTREKYFAALQNRQSSLWQAVAEPLKAAISGFEANGFVINLGHMHPRINSVAVPIWSPDGNTALSLSCGGISDVFSPDILPRIGRDLKELAKKLGPTIAFNVRQAVLPIEVEAADTRPPSSRP